MINFTHRWPQSGHFFSKLGHFFPIFEKGREKPSPPPPSSYVPEYTHFLQKQLRGVFRALSNIYDRIFFLGKGGLFMDIW